MPPGTKLTSYKFTKESTHSGIEELKGKLRMCKRDIVEQAIQEFMAKHLNGSIAKDEDRPGIA